MRIVHMVSSIGKEASGPSYTVPRLCRALADRGHEVELHVLRWTQSTPPVPGVELHVHPFFPVPRKLGFSRSMERGLATAAARADVVHSHGLWMMSNIYAARAARQADVPLVTSPRGTLAPAALSHSRVAKRLMWSLAQADAARRADVLHATSEDEVRQVRTRIRDARVALIPNGVDVPLDMEATHPPRATRNLLFLGRVHPIKGVDLLLHAWSELEVRHKEWSLNIVGPSIAEHGEAMQRLTQELGLSRVNFLGPRYGREKQQMYADADLFVLPTETENFGMSVAEALACRVPVIVTKGAPWSGLETKRCGLWIDRTRPALVHALDSAMSLTASERAEMGTRGREWMVSDFSWGSVASRFEQLYSALGGAGNLDACLYP